MAKHKEDNVLDCFIRQKRYWRARLRQFKGTKKSIAVGVACGVSVSFTPFVGIHTLLAVFMAWLLGGNLLAAILGTAFGNPWTFPFIWVSVLYTGRKILGSGYEGVVGVDFDKLFSKSIKALIDFDFKMFVHDIWPVFYPMIVGAIPYVIIFWFLSYFFVKNILENKKYKMKNIK